MFQCEVCQLLKHTRTSYPLQLYKPSNPFSMIYNTFGDLLDSLTFQV